MDDFTVKDKKFIRALITAVCSSAITGKNVIQKSTGKNIQGKIRHDKLIRTFIPMNDRTRYTYSQSNANVPMYMQSDTMCTILKYSLYTRELLLHLPPFVI